MWTFFFGQWKSVQAAGQLKVNSQGYVRRIDNLSGHYSPNVEQGKLFPGVLNKAGIETKNAWLELYDINIASSGYADLSKVTKYSSTQLK